MKPGANYERVFRIACPALTGTFASVYPHYVAKVEKSRLGDRDDGRAPSLTAPSRSRLRLR